MNELLERKPDHVEQDIITSHEYDGIKEFDNPLPRWWLLTFYGAIIFSVGYWFWYHNLEAGALPHAELAMEVEEAEREMMAKGLGGFATEEELAEFTADAEMIEAGREQFNQHCWSCHGRKGEGKSGPNLTDNYWIHGHRPLDNYITIAKGWEKKGMPAWKRVVGETKVRQLTAYVVSLRNTNVPGAPPQGEPAPE